MEVLPAGPVSRRVFVYLCICVFVHLYICTFVYLNICISLFVYYVCLRVDCGSSASRSGV